MQYLFHFRGQQC